jgi:hypothetical protein
MPKSSFSLCLINGGTALFAIALFISMTYNAWWDDCNFWRNQQFGRQRRIHNYAILIVFSSLFSLLFLIAAIVFRLSRPDHRTVTFFLCLASFILGFVVTILQGVALEYTTYGDAHLSTQYAYYEFDKDFREYVDRYTDTVWQGHGDLSQPAPTGLVTGDLNWTEYMQPYVVFSLGEYRDRLITPCFFNWSALMERPARFAADDPCMFDLGDDDALGCIGSWTGSLFRRFWCYAYRTWLDELAFAKKNDWATVQEARVRREVSWWSVASLSAFYRHNLYLVEVLGASLAFFLMPILWTVTGSGPEDS